MTAERLTECKLRAKLRGYAGPTGRNELRNYKRLRQVGTKCHERPAIETFDEFLIAHLKYRLGKSWGRSEVKLAREKQHAIIRWMFDHVELQKSIGLNEVPNTPVGYMPTGGVKALMSLADDIYRLALVESLPDGILTRIRKRNSFQGARYELALAAAFVRAGFRISWLEEVGKHAEFVAVAPWSGDEVVVEAKSRRRPGILHENGDANTSDWERFRSDIGGLYGDAIKKPTDGRPFVIGIDLNLPISGMLNPQNPGRLDELDRALKRHSSSPDYGKEFCVAFTNFSWHYNPYELAPAPEVLFYFSSTCNCIPGSDETITAILQGIEQYGQRPENVY